MEPLFLPGDQKTLVRRGAAHPRLITIGFFMLMVGTAIVGISCLYVGEWAAGIILTIFGVGVAGVMVQRRFSEAQMVKRMRKRATESSNERKSTCAS